MITMQCDGYNNLVIVEYLGHPGIREYLSFMYLFNFILSTASIFQALINV